MFSYYSSFFNFDQKLDGVTHINLQLNIESIFCMLIWHQCSAVPSRRYLYVTDEFSWNIKSSIFPVYWIWSFFPVYWISGCFRLTHFVMVQKNKQLKLGSLFLWEFYMTKCFLDSLVLHQPDENSIFHAND